MKKLCVTVFLCALMFIFCSCSEKLGIDGIENFRQDDSNYELNVYLLPSEDFIAKFEHINVDYRYRAEYETYLSVAGTERTLVVMEYGQEAYEKAKTYCIENLQLSDTNTVEYNNYTFIENIALPVAQDRYGKSNSFPKWFNMFAYNDELRRIVFIGFYSPDYTSADAQNVCDNWGMFLEKYFSDIYDWGQGDGSLVSS